jgi:hypothetical protein
LSLQEQQIFADQIKCFITEQRVFTNGAIRLRNLLNDVMPGHRIEQFWLCSVLEMPSFVSALNQGQVLPIDLSRVEFFLHHKLGLALNIAKWTSSIWANALGFNSVEKRTSFDCPHCGLSGSCNELWTYRIATCPACNAQMRFNGSLELSLERSGWPKKRLKNREWLLSDPDLFKSQSAIREAISNTIENDKLSSTEIAKYIGLDLIVSSLRTEVASILIELMNRSLAVNGNVIKAILRSSLRDEYLCFDFDNDFPTPACLVEEKHSSPDERWIAIIGSSTVTPFHLLGFSDRALYYANGRNHWTVSYLDLHRLPITLGQTITQLNLGDSRQIDLKGLGVPRWPVQLTLSLLGQIVFEISDGVWQ